MRHKLGLFTEQTGDGELIQSWLDLLEQSGADFTLSFRALCEAAEDDAGYDKLSRLVQGYEAWSAAWLNVDHASIMSAAGTDPGSTRELPALMVADALNESLPVTISAPALPRN